MRYCSAPRCRNMVQRGKCLAHAKAYLHRYDQMRGSASSRGYGSKWSRYRAKYLRDHPLCGDRAWGTRETKDSECAAAGLYIVATVVDHITPVTGPDDPTFYEPQAHQALCKSCHDKKRQRERR